MARNPLQDRLGYLIAVRAGILAIILLVWALAR